jgi:hypothetical protein
MDNVKAYLASNKYFSCCTCIAIYTTEVTQLTRYERVHIYDSPIELGVKI